MKIILILLLFIAPALYAQTLKETSDKFQNLTTVSFEDKIDLETKDDSPTIDLEINLFKITKEDKIVYAFQLVAETDIAIKCEEESKCIFLYNDSTTIELGSVSRDYAIFKRTLTTTFNIPVYVDDLLALQDANKIAVKIYCLNGSYEGRFAKDELKEFKNGIKMIMK